MQKLASEFEKITIVTREERTVLGFLENVIINPADKSIVGMLMKAPTRKGGEAIFNTSCIAGLGTNFIMIRRADDISPPDEIIRIKEILDLGIKISGSKVIDENGKYLGKVRDWSVNLKTMYLSRLYVTPSNLLKAFVQDLMIFYTDIIKIEKDKILVRGGSVKSKGESAKISKARSPVGTETAKFIKEK